MSRQSKDIMIIGFALFAMFLGAGNLIFPPFLGFQSGDGWIRSATGFLVSGVGLSILGILAVTTAGGKTEALAEKVSPLFATLLTTTIILTIGPLVAIPRTAATAYELGILSLFPQVPAILSSLLFFAVTLWLVINPTNVIDKLGKILTPVMLFLLLGIIIKGIFFPSGVPTTSTMQAPFADGFLLGYQTMDALASVIFAGTIVTAVKARGYQEQEVISITSKAGCVAGIALASIYGGLILLGANAMSMLPADASRSDVLTSVTHMSMGEIGVASMAIVVILACLTTAVGLTTTVGHYFQHLSRGRLPYRWLVSATVIFSALLANAGIDRIVQFAGPILDILYPVVIVLIILNLLERWVSLEDAYVGSVVGVLSLRLLDILLLLGISHRKVEGWLEMIPFSEYGLAWLLPAFFGGVLSWSCKRVWHLIPKER
ncbi:branched-chain amino acid transport system II carrier protein [Tindallia californiensis]|uniref:Branched-chain amino acid transport system carrier protein n=1 Tax=Tindallia californiensis TaxID=159292 RepID=A0A1H3PC52_9FIRM|nr:branched-chain amino acid transport system II carrier protein [Tindallia californiensis]SDY97969.1 branched-chain amino acid:cation transporter, LIVCS family [Tindallia californiensis]